MSLVSKEMAELIYTYIKENQPATSTNVWKYCNASRQHTHSTLRFLEKEGYIYLLPESGPKSMKWGTTDKKMEKPEQLCIQIEIKPDLAAMWLQKSKPQWDKRSIPIVRSIGLGVRRNTL
jgi:hypothetical protein